MAEEDSVDLRTDLPHGARIWNYWLGGRDNYPADRAVGDAVREAFPTVAEYAVLSRQFLIRAVMFLAGEAGIRQFLDVGTGLPTMQNTHEVAQAVNPTARIVYVDNDPLVLTHARALLRNTTAEGVTTYVDADYRDPESIISQARETLDFTQPVAVMCMGVFGYLDDPAQVRSIVSALLDPLPSGSYLALWDATDTSEAARTASNAQAEMGSPYALRAVAEIGSWFERLELVEPGLVTVTGWRPVPSEDVEAVDAYGAIARKP